MTLHCTPGELLKCNPFEKALAPAALRFLLCGTKFVMPFGTNGMMFQFKPPHKVEVVGCPNRGAYKLLEMIRRNPKKLFWSAGCALGYSFGPGFLTSKLSAKIHGGLPYVVYRQRAYVTRGLWLSPRFKKVKFVHCHPVELIKEHDSEDTCFFIECPLWPNFHRREEALELFKHLKGMALIVGGGWCNQYDRLLNHGYKRVAMVMRGKYYRMLGENKFYYKGPKNDYY